MDGLENALSWHADKTHNEILASDEERNIAKRLFLDMAHIKALEMISGNQVIEVAVIR